MRQFTWDEKIARAEKLAKQYASTSQLLNLYVKLARFQKHVSQTLNGSPGNDIRALLEFVPELDRFVANTNSAFLKAALAELGTNQDRWTELLLEYWQKQGAIRSAAEAFLAYSLIQPYAQYVASHMSTNTAGDFCECPACGNLP